MKRAYPAYCPGQEWQGLSLDDGFKHFEALGFKWFDGNEDWATLRKGAFEAFIRRENAIVWHATVAQLEAA